MQFLKGPVQIYNGPSFLRLSSTKEKLVPVCKPLYGFIKCSKVIVENGDSSVNFSIVNYIKISEHMVIKRAKYTKQSKCRNSGIMSEFRVSVHFAL